MCKNTGSENVWKELAKDLQDRLDPDHIEPCHDLLIAVKVIIQKFSEGLSRNNTEVWVNNTEHFTKFCLAPVRPEPPKKSFWKKLEDLFKD